MSWMAVYYANMISMRSELERETERHRATAVRLQKARDLAEKANGAKSIFLAKMSHELRTPLNAVIGYSEILLEDAEIDGKPEEKITDLRRINTAGKHLLSLVTDVLDLSKIESNTMELNVQHFDLGDFMDEVVATSKPLFSANRNSLTVKCPENVGTASTDPTKLRQVILNVLSNAAKFTTDGTVTLSLRRKANQAADWIEFQIQDTGIGIADHDLPKLFQDFGQATASTASKFGGTGLGLAVSQKLCALMGGGIYVESQLGSGSCFTIRVPAVLEEVQTDSMLPTAPPATSPLALLPA
jgi:signal transduction histidine kinase